jgi:Thioredoxin-like domain
MFRALTLSLVMFVSVCLPTQAGGAFELLFVERDGCPWCVRFEKEILPIYGKTEAGQQAPVVRHNLGQGQPQAALLDEPVRFTPTFVILKDRKEIGRITGYMNDAMFWGLLEKKLAEHKDLKP